MLKITAIQHPQQRFETLGFFNPQTDLWLSVDLESKKRIQDFLKTRHQGFSKNSILRLEDFWIQELFRYDPNWKVISRPLLLIEADFFLQEFSLDWMKGRNGAKKLVSLFETLGPYVLHPHLEPLLDEWLEKNPEAQIRWRHLWEAVKRFAPRIFEKKWITASLIPHLLLDGSYVHKSSYKKIILDSGFYLKPAEYFIFEKIAQQTELEWLKPQGDWFKDDGYWTGERKLQIDIAALPKADVTLMKFHSQLAETKNIVAELRSSLDEGKALDEHHLLLLEAETQWPSLRWHMRKEGLPWQAQPMKLHGFQSIQRWLATLRAQNPWALFSDQEVSRYAQNTPAEAYDRFAQKNRSIEYWSMATMPSDRLSAEDFFKAWGEDNLDPYVSHLLQKAMTDFPNQWKLSFNQWTHYLENLALLTEIHSNEEKRWNNSLPLSSSFTMVPNLHQDLQKDIEETDIPLSQLQVLRRDLGWPVDGADSTQLEASLRWLTEDPSSRVIMSYAEKDFLGAYKIPHRLFTIWSQQKGLQRALPTVRWNELQDQQKTENLVEPNQNFKIDANFLKKEKKSNAELENKVILSPSALERFEDCAFMLVAERHFRLSSSPDFELDLDRVTRGRIQHALFEKILTNDPKQWLDEALLKQILTDVFKDLEIDFVDTAFQKMMEAFYLRLMFIFVQQELAYRKLHPQNKTVAMELDLKVDLTQDFTVRGRIDRVDQDGEGHYWISDYKSSKNNLNNWKKWLENGQYQLALYAEAVEEGKTKLPPHDVEAATYIIVKEDSRQMGFFKEQAKEHFFEKESRAQGKITDAEWLELKIQMKNRWNIIFQKYSQGELLPVPRDTKICDTCSWRGLCRAPHLR